MNTRHLMIRRLREHVNEIDSFTEGLSAEELQRAPSGGGWSLHELALHLAETQEIFAERIARMLVEESPAISPFVPDEARSSGLYLTRNLPENLGTFRRQRATLLVLLESLSDAQWRLEGKHPEMPYYTVEKCVESLMRHEEHHLYRMFTVFFGTRR